MYKRQLTDFAKIFFGKGGNTGPLIVGYELPEIVKDLNDVVKYDWATFLHDRISNVNPRADLDGIEHGGYKLVYQDHPSRSERTLSAANSRRGGGLNVWYSLGTRLTADGTVGDIRWNSPADKAKLAPGEKILVVNGQVFSAEALRAAVVKAKTEAAPIHLQLQQESDVVPVDIDYHDGERYPVMVRTEGTPAYLDDITKPLTVPQGTPAKTSN